MCVEAYAAALIDGEGCIFIRQYKDKGVYRYGLAISVKMVDKGPVAFMHDCWPGSFGSYSIAASGKICWQWTIYGQRAQEFLREIKRFIQGKKDQVELALEFPVYKRGRYTDQVTKDLQSELFLKMKESRH